MAESLEEGAVQVDLARKAAAWQWLMRGGASADAPLHTEISVRGPPAMASLGFRPPSRFASEAALLPQTPRSLLLDDVDLAKLGAAVSHQSARHRRPKLGEDEASRISLCKADGYAEKKARLVQSDDRRGLHLHFPGFQKLLRKLLPSKSGKKFMASALASVRSDSEEETQHRYVYHHHHHHHHYHYNGAAPLVDKEQPHLGTLQPRRRRHSESGFHYLAQQYHLCPESTQIEEDDQQNEFSSVEQHFLSTITKRDHGPQHPMKPPAGVEAPVKRQTLNNVLSPPIKRIASERFTDTTNKAHFSDEDDKTQSRVARCSSERRQLLHLKNRIIAVDDQNHYFLSSQFFDSSNGKSQNVASGAVSSPTKRKPRRHSANFYSLPLH